MTRTTQPPRPAFTLIEVLIVLAIVLLLAGLVGVSVFNRRDKADADVAKINLNVLRSALDAFRYDFRRYPTEEEGLAVLWDKSLLDPEADAALWSGYLREPLTADPWGSPFGYRLDDAAPALASAGTSSDSSADIPEPTYDLWSNGPDKREDTADDVRVGAAAATDAAGSDLIPPPSGSP
jgi:general secretion pathway protein G